MTLMSGTGSESDNDSHFIQGLGKKKAPGLIKVRP